MNGTVQRSLSVHSPKYLLFVTDEDMASICILVTRGKDFRANETLTLRSGEEIVY